MLWFESTLPVAVLPGWTYAIDEPVIGGTYRRQSGQWVMASPDPTADIRTLPPESSHVTSGS